MPPPKLIQKTCRARLIAGVVAFATLGGCATPRPDVAGDAARLSGVENAIVFREEPVPFDGPPPEDRSLTPARAVRMALGRDPRVQAALARVRVAEADAHQARLLPNPILTIDLRYPIDPSNTAFEPSLTADLLSLLQKPAQISAADDRLRGAAQAALVTVLDVIGEVEEALAAARSADAEIENARHRMERLQRVRDIAQKRLQAGDATRLDVLTLDAQVMAAELEVSDLELQRDDDRLALNRLLGYARTDPQWEIAAWQAPAGEALAPEAAWVDSALANRPEIAAKVWELRALGEEVRGAAIPPIGGGEIGAHGERDPEWRLGPVASIPLPIFDFGQATREKVRAERVAARHELAQAQLEVIQNVRSTYAAYTHARRALGNARDRLLPLQSRQLENAQRAYQAGEADLATLLLAQNEYEQTRGKIVELEEKVTVARSKLLRAAGGGGVAVPLGAGGAQGGEGTSRPTTLPSPSTRPSLQEPQPSHPATGPAR
jgi:cobalt-zinc-cadmium efflux system outer membrane protein